MKDPLGIGGEQLHEWAFGAMAWREQHGLEGGEDNADSDVSSRSLRARRRRDHGPQDVQRRLRAVGGRPERPRLVGRRPAVPPPGLRAHPPRARAAGDGGRDDVPLRHRRRPRPRYDQARAAAGDKDDPGPRRRQRRCSSTSSRRLLDELQVHDRARCCSAAATPLLRGVHAGRLERERVVESPTGVVHVNYALMK